MAVAAAVRVSRSGKLDTRSNMRLFWSMQRVGGSGELGMAPATVSQVAISISSARQGGRCENGDAADVGADRPDDRTDSREGRARSDVLRAAVELAATGDAPAGRLGRRRRKPRRRSARLARIPDPVARLLRRAGPAAYLQNVPLEYFEKALQWLASQPSVDPNRITVIGVSRGGEAALLVAANYPDLVHGSIACTTDSHVLGAYPPPAASGAAWTIGGKPVLTGLLPVDKITAPTLIYGGGKDEVADSANATRELADFAHAHGRANVTGTVFPNAGHGVGCRIPNIPAPTEFELKPGTFGELGGTSARTPRQQRRVGRRGFAFSPAAGK